MDKYVAKINGLGYIKEIAFPMQQSIYTQDMSEAQRFYDKKWLSAKIEYYLGAVEYEITPVEDETEGNLIKILREIDEKLNFVRVSLHFTDYDEHTWTVPERLTKEIIDRVKGDLSIDEIKLYIRT